jgi:hypothetical protein
VFLFGKIGYFATFSTSFFVMYRGAKLTVPAGEVRLVAAKGSTEVSLVRDANGFLPLPAQIPTVESVGNIFVDNSVISTEGNSGGRLTLWAGDVNFNHGLFNANNNGDLNAGLGKGVKSSSLNLNILNNSAFSADSLGKGDAASVGVTVIDSLNLLYNAFISANVVDKGDGGNVTVNAGTLYIDSLWRPTPSYYGEQVPFPVGFMGAGIGSDVYGAGNAGIVKVNANKIQMDTNVWISSDTFNTGNGGDIFVIAKDISNSAKVFRYRIGYFFDCRNEICTNPIG